MQKFLLTPLLAILSLSLYAQTIEEVQEKMDKQKWSEAQEKIDKYLAVEKNAKKADGWYYKAVIYNNLSKDSSQAANAASYKTQAFNAYKKYVELDSKLILGTLNQNVHVWDMFYSYNEMAINAFNKKNFDAALEHFKNAAMVEDYIVSKKWSYNGQVLPALDTSLILNTAAAAVQAKKLDEAALLYGKIADARLAAKDYVEIYEFLVNHYDKKQDMTNRNKYLAIGKELYPANNYWLEVELSEAGDDKKKIFAKYDELIAKNPNKLFLYYNLGAELFNYTYTSEAKPADYLQMQDKIEDVLKRGIAVESTPDINLLLARHLYNLANDINDQSIAIKGTKPEDVKKKADLKAKFNAELEEMLKYATAASNAYEAKATLKPGERGNLKVATNLILYYWEMKKNPAKIKEYSDKMKSTGD